MRLEIVYQDEWLVAVNKPANMLVHRSWLARHETQFVMQTLRDQLNQHVFTVHRLDRPTSGVLLFGLSAEAGRLLSQKFEQHSVHKTYHALLRGWLQSAGTLDYPLLEQRDKIADKHASGEPALQSAITDYQPLAKVEMPVATGPYPTSRYSLVRLIPATGRKHQLRRHMSHLRHPIIGDTAHGDLRQNRGAATHFGCHRLMLHASRLVLEHPYTGKLLRIDAPPDACWQHLFAQFNWSLSMLESASHPGRAEPDGTM